MQLSNETKQLIVDISAMKDVEFKEQTNTGIKSLLQQVKRLLDTLKETE